MKTFLVALPLLALLTWWLLPADPEIPEAAVKRTAVQQPRPPASESRPRSAPPRAAERKIVRGEPPAPASESRLTRHDDRMTEWLLETGQRAQNLRVHEVARRPGRDRSMVIEGISDDGHSLKEHVDAEGRLIADEVIFRDGRKLSRLYHPDGKFKAVYFEQHRERAYSGLFDETGRTVEVTELTRNGKHTRRNPDLN